MTRVELMDTLRRCGLNVKGRHDGKIHVPGYEPAFMTEAQAMQVVEHLAKSHCLHCGRPFKLNGSR